MFPKQRITGVNGSTISLMPPNQASSSYMSTKRLSEMPNKVEASMNVGGGVGGGSGASTNVQGFWSSQYQYYMTGLLPANPEMTDSSPLALFYRDCYMFDATAGSAVDLLSSFPFSDFDCRGLSEEKLQVYSDSLSQLNIRRMLEKISKAYLVDGFFCGSLIYDDRRKQFTDTLIHDALQCSVLPSPFFNEQPIINVRVGGATSQFMNNPSRRARRYLDSLPQAFVDMLKMGSFELSPVTTLYVARQSLNDRAYTSFLHRILPMYLIEKTMFRGTLVEAARRQRATSHLTAGDDTWTPSGEELSALVEAFMRAEFDPMGGWVSTRSSVQVTDIRPGGEFWKWTDMADILVPYKLRALGISESFLSGDATFASAEQSYSVFLETSNAYRGDLTHSIFDSTLFPLIAVANGFYKEGAERVKGGNIAAYLANVQNRSNLEMPQLVWHKSLEAISEENTFDMLEKASEKGVPIPLKSWMAAASIDSESLLKDLKDDTELRAKLEQYTGKDTAHESEDSEGDDMETAMMKLHGSRLTSQSIKTAPTGGRAILARDWGDGLMYDLTRTGKKKHIINQASRIKEANVRIAKISAKAARDPEYRKQLAKRNLETLGQTTLTSMHNNKNPKV